MKHNRTLFLITLLLLLSRIEGRFKGHWFCEVFKASASESVFKGFQKGLSVEFGYEIKENLLFSNLLQEILNFGTDRKTTLFQTGSLLELKDVYQRYFKKTMGPNFKLIRAGMGEFLKQTMADFAHRLWINNNFQPIDFSKVIPADFYPNIINEFIRTGVITFNTEADRDYLIDDLIRKSDHFLIPKTLVLVDFIEFKKDVPAFLTSCMMEMIEAMLEGNSIIETSMIDLMDNYLVFYLKAAHSVKFVEEAMKILNTDESYKRNEVILRKLVNHFTRIANAGTIEEMKKATSAFDKYFEPRVMNSPLSKNEIIFFKALYKRQGSIFFRSLNNRFVTETYQLSAILINKASVSSGKYFLSLEDMKVLLIEFVNLNTGFLNKIEVWNVARRLIPVQTFFMDSYSELYSTLLIGTIYFSLWQAEYKLMYPERLIYHWNQFLDDWLRVSNSSPDDFCQGCLSSDQTDQILEYFGNGYIHVNYFFLKFAGILMWLRESYPATIEIASFDYYDDWLIHKFTLEKMNKKFLMFAKKSLGIEGGFNYKNFKGAIFDEDMKRKFVRQIEEKQAISSRKRVFRDV